jgi:acetylornithine deacetylase
MHNESLFQDAITLLRELISLPSFSREEDRTADAIIRLLTSKGVSIERIGHNILAQNKHFNPSLPTLLLNSHHDTVKPNKSYTLDPFTPIERDGKLFGLGSNDAGGCLVSLIATFLYFYERSDLTHNLVLAATAEEEISGTNGIELALTKLPIIEAAIVGEPTKMDLAVAERGLLVLDCVAHGRSGHAARNEGENALYAAIQDIQWMNSYVFPRSSTLLGPVKMTVTVMETDNKAHNVVPDTCRFVADVRINEQYQFEEILEIIRAHVTCDIKPRSLRMRSSMIPLDHPLVEAGIELGRNVYGSPTTSDKALMPFPALKMGPGDSARSHTADEFIYVDELRNGISLYIELLSKLVTTK